MKESEIHLPQPGVPSYGYAGTAERPTGLVRWGVDGCFVYDPFKRDWEPVGPGDPDPCSFFVTGDTYLTFVDHAGIDEIIAKLDDLALAAS